MKAEHAFGIFELPLSYQVNFDYLKKKRLALHKTNHTDGDHPSNTKFIKTQQAYELIVCNLERAKLILQHNNITPPLPTTEDLERYLSYSDDITHAQAMLAKIEITLTDAFAENKLDLAAYLTTEMQFLRKCIGR